MNCVNCGTPITPEQQFCRSCGAELTAGQPRSAGQRMLVGLIMVFGGIVIALIGRMLMHEEMIVLAGVLVSIAGMFFIAAYPFLVSSLRQRRRNVQTPRPDQLPAAETTKKLSPIGDLDFVPSVTENTTELLKVPAVRRSSEDN